MCQPMICGTRVLWLGPRPFQCSESTRVTRSGSCDLVITQIVRGPYLREPQSIATKLAWKDERSPEGLWMRTTPMLIGTKSGPVSKRLADQLGWDRLTLKRDIRKLKSLGTTISLDVGYRLSNKGEALLRWSDRHDSHGFLASVHALSVEQKLFHPRSGASA